MADIKTFAEFYPYYLSEHQLPACRALHYVGSSFGLFFIGTAILSANAWWLLAALVSGYAMAWIGHFFIEKNRPATFTYPFYSFAADWVMFFDFLTGRLNKKLAQVESAE
jgi:hypothetical protein